MKRLSILSLLILFGCKTTEEVQREKEFSNLSMQVVEGQKIGTTALTRMSEIEQKVASLQGQIEETRHTDRTEAKEEIDQLKMRIKSLEDNSKNLKEQLAKAETKIAEQTKFIKNVTSALAKINKPARKSPKKTNKSKKSKNLPLYDKALSLYKKRKYKQARPILENLSKSKKLSANKKARVIHNLGMIAFIFKKYSDSTTYFSQVFTNFPKSGYVPNSLLYLGKTFQATKQKELAKETFNELIAKFPGGKHAKEAQSLLKKM